MTALTAPRNTPKMSQSSHIDLLAVPVKANAVIYQGALVAVDATGYLVPASASATLRVLGRAEQSADATGKASGDLTVEVRAGAFLWNISGTDAVTQADVFKTVYAVDDQTIGKTDLTGTLSAAGVLYALVDGKAYVASLFR